MIRKNATEMCSTHNEGRSAVSERFIGTLEIKTDKYTNSVSKNVSIDELDEIVNKYNKTYHKIITMKFVNVKSWTYIGSSEEINDQNPEFKVGYIVRILKYKNIFAKGYVAN